MASIPEEQHLQALLQALSAAIRVMGSVVSRNTEIVLHDLRHLDYSIAEIANAHVTGRKKGDSVLAGMRTDRAFIYAMENRDEPVTLLLDYVTWTREGKPMRSSTAIYRDAKGMPYAALCINVDNTGIENALQTLFTLTGVTPEQAVRADTLPQTETAPGNIEGLMQDIIKTTTALEPGHRRTDVKRANMMAVKSMQEKGIFLIKGGVEKAAEALGVTRYTIYNYLDELKNYNK